MTHCLERRKTSNEPIGYILLDKNYNFISYSKSDKIKSIENLWQFKKSLNDYNTNVKKEIDKLIFDEKNSVVKLPVFPNDYSFYNVVEIILDHLEIDKTTNIYYNQSYSSFIKNMNHIIESKDKYTAFHSKNVKNYSISIAEYLNFSKKDLGILSIAANLHDIGKIIINENIITKKTSLSFEEFESVKVHSIKGFEILSKIESFETISTIVKQHHERFDGRGYPDGVMGDQINLNARIIGIADSFDAMTTNRPYRKALSLEQALNELVKNKNAQFDGKLIEIFSYLLKNDKLRYR